MVLLRRRTSGPRLEGARDWEVATSDPWRSVGAEEPVPAEGDVVVSLTRWSNEREALRARAGRLGVRIPNDTASPVLAELAVDASLIEVEIPKLRDGRAYSVARLLRSRFGYGGELRAVGSVARDQLLFLARVGFDALALASGSAEAALSAFDELGVRYQASSDEPLPLWKRAARGRPDALEG
jgi:uncharacterized protein (DUF934 family)